MFQSVLGLVALTGLAWLLSENRRKVRLRTIVAGIGLQVAVAFIFLKVPLFEKAFLALNGLVLALDAATTEGTTFVFGYLGGGPLPFTESFPGQAFILAFKSLPLILVVGALSSLLFYWGVIPFIVRMISKFLQKTMDIGGALGVGVSVNIFVGMVEAPLFVKPYLERMTRSELFTLMTTGLATIAGTMLVIYAAILKPVIPNSLGQILVASIISVPAAIMIAKIMIPETGDKTEGDVASPNDASGAMDAVVKGGQDGLAVLLNVAAMLIVLIALVSLINQILAFIPYQHSAPVTLQRIVGIVMRPFVWLIGVPWSEASTAGALMGVKTILNEFIAYDMMSKLSPDVLSERSRMIMTYAMCGFANPGSLGIMVGGMGVMAPSRRPEIVSLGIRSVIAGTMATLMTGAVVGLMY